MFNLIKNNFRRLFKDVLLYILLIITAVFILGILIIALAFRENYNGLTAYIGSISPDGNFGLMLPILLIIFICKDFSYGTIRNKIIAGYKKSTIYFASLISSLIFGIAAYLIYTLLTLGLITALNGYGSGYELLRVLPFSLLMYSVIICQAHFLAFLYRKTAPSIITHIGVVIATTIFTTVFTLSMVDNSTLASTIYAFFPSGQYNLMALSKVGFGTTLPGLFDNNLWLIAIAADIFYIAAFTVGGYFATVKRDFK